MNTLDSSESTESLRHSVDTFDVTIGLDGAARATLSATWVYNQTTRESHAVLMMVDLVPDEIPLVDVLPDWDERLGGQSDWRVFSQCRELPSEEARSWYNTLVHTGVWTPPWKPLTLPVALSNTLNEPRWPNAVTLKKAQAVPFAARRGGGTRLHHLLSEAPQLDAILKDDFGRLASVIEKRLDIDLNKTPELWQSAHFFQPLPFLRHVATRLDSSDKADEEAVLVDIAPRKGVSLGSFIIDVFERRPTGIRLLARFRPTAPFHRVPVNERIEQIGVRAYHDKAGLLVDEGPYPFMRSAHIEMNVITHERRVPLPERKGLPAEVKRIPMSGMEQSVITGSDPGRSAARVLYGAYYRLKSRAQERDRQMWFGGDVAIAEDAIQKLLSGAKRTAILVDPYFAADEIRVWLPSVATRGAEIQVLTSSHGLKQRSIPDAPPGEKLKGTALERAHLERLVQGLADAKKQNWVNPTTVRVMRGNPPPIHDRFLVADDRVWLLGSSLNQFGSRGTMIVELPLPGEVLPKIENVWKNESELLEKRLADLQAKEAEK